jgi:uncharacterized protein (TIGR00251 family)
MSDLRIEQDGTAVRVWVKAVPGASRDQVAGILGDRLKVRVSAPAEGGRANKAICEAIAKTLKIKAKQVTIESGQMNPEKIVRIEGARAEDLRAQLEYRDPAASLQ